MSEVPPVAVALTQKGIPHRLFYHQGSVASLEQAAQERNQVPAQVVRSILFRLGADQYAMVLMAGGGRSRGKHSASTLVNPDSPWRPRKKYWP